MINKTCFARDMLSYIDMIKRNESDVGHIVLRYSVQIPLFYKYCF